MKRRSSFDAIVIGSGITGGWAAKELTQQGLDVLVLERGRNVRHGVDYVTEHLPESAFEFRGLGDRQGAERSQLVQSKHWVYDEATRHFLINDLDNPYTTAAGTEFSWIRGWQLGGRSLLWSRQCLRMTDLDFEANARQGIAVDWPLRFADLEPWYEYVESFIGISAQAGIHPTIPTRAQPPLAMSAAEAAVCTAYRKAFPQRVFTASPQAVLTQPLNGRLPCHHCGPCERGCSTGSYFSSLSSTLPAAQATGRLTLRTDAIVQAILDDPRSKRVAGVRVMNAHTRDTTEFRARMVFLCASAMESVRLLLNSTSARHPHGLGNSSGVLGHYLIDHVSGVAAEGELPGIDTGKRYYSGHHPGMSHVPRFQNLGDERHDFQRGFHLQIGSFLSGWRRAIGASGLGERLKQQLQDPGPWQVTVGCQGECLPMYGNRMSLDPKVRDAWGTPVPRFEFTWGDNEFAMRRNMAQAAQEMLHVAGASNIRLLDVVRPPGDDNHEMGGARMGRDPASSFLNGFNQSHDVPNLFVTDGACMTSAGNQNPSLTYMALTARACHYAVERLKKGEL